jgi:hypothetical protein
MGSLETGIARASAPADAADGAQVDAYHDLKGRRVVRVDLAPPRNVVGAHANAWNAAAVGAGGTSASVDCQNTPFVSAFGNASAATTITVQYSQNDVDYYDGPNQVLGGAGNFRIDATVGARYVRLKSSAAATITATIAGKG